MGLLVIASFEDLPIGQVVVRPLSDDSEPPVHYQMPIFVIRKATVDEYVEGAGNDDRTARVINIPGVMYFEVSVD